MSFHKKTIMTLDRIVSLCKDSPKSTLELSKILEMNYNTLRSKYVYVLCKENRLKREGRKYKVV